MSDRAPDRARPFRTAYRAAKGGKTLSDEQAAQAAGVDRGRLNRALYYGKALTRDECGRLDRYFSRAPGRLYSAMLQETQSDVWAHFNDDLNVERISNPLQELMAAMTPHDSATGDLTALFNKVSLVPGGAERFVRALHVWSICSPEEIARIASALELFLGGPSAE